MRKITIAGFLLVSTLQVFAQQKGFWHSPATAVDSGNIFPEKFQYEKYKLFILKESLFSKFLKNAPSENTLQITKSGFILPLPLSDGTMEEFRCVESFLMEEGLAKKNRDIHTYTGQGIHDRSAVAHITISPEGFSGMITSAANSTVYIDPLPGHDSLYSVFSRNDAYMPGIFNCSVKDSIKPASKNNNMPEQLRSADDGKLRTFRLALACTGEYAQYFLNGTEQSDSERKTKVLNAMIILLTRINGIFERDFGIRLVLVSNNDAIIFLNPATDPWTDELNVKTQNTLDAAIGNNNYDIGHLLAKGGPGGNAGCIGCVCKPWNGLPYAENNNFVGKGGAYSSFAFPYGDPFVVNYVSHEIGHQFGANHTFSHSLESPNPVQMEPSTGSTIMGYAGVSVVPAEIHIQKNSDDYFHAKTIEQVTDYIKSVQGGGACAAVINTGNHPPFVTIPPNYIIPKSTPFILTANASDADGDLLTYTWEQIDAATENVFVPIETKTTGPLFRSMPYSVNPSRTFPVLASILDGTNIAKWEKNPSVSRSLNFRVTVRDNHAGGGNATSADAVLTVDGNSGPFTITSPNSSVSWMAGSQQLITWNVNGTNQPPVACNTVNLLLSTDGGINFTPLLHNTSNDGQEYVTVPNTPTSMARIKVQAVGNIFFDINNADFTITAPGVQCATPAGLICTYSNSNYLKFRWNPVATATSYYLMYRLTGSSGSSWQFASFSATDGTITGLQPAKQYDIGVKARCGNYESPVSQVITCSTSGSARFCNQPIGLLVSNITSNSATLSWAADPGATAYDVYLVEPDAMRVPVAINYSGQTTVSINTLSPATTYWWEIRSVCNLNKSQYSYISFTTPPLQTGCPAPANFRISEIYPSALYLTWDAVINANSYILRYSVPPATTTWDVELFGTNFGLLPLNPNTLYKLQIRSKCSNTLLSGFSDAIYGRTSGDQSPYAKGSGTTGTAAAFVFPNPAHETITVVIPGTKTNGVLNLYDAEGKIRKVMPVAPGNNTIDIRSLTSGLYLIRVFSDKNEILQSLKFLKQ